MNSKKSTIQVIQQKDNPDIHIETGELARQADGSVLVKCGKAMLLATAVERKEKESLGFLPLSVDYQEKFYAAGKIPGGFLKREARSSEQEILISRLVDRSLRPCFPKNYHHAVQVTIWLLSADENIAADTLATLAASVALTISPIPFQGPISGVRVARIKGKLHINPPTTMLPQADINVMMSATLDNLVMIEGSLKEVSEQDLLEALQHGHQAIKKQCTIQQDLATQLGVEKNTLERLEEDAVLEKKFIERFYQPCYQIAQKAFLNKKVRNEAFKKMQEDYLTNDPEGKEIDIDVANRYFFIVKSKAIKDLLIKENIRIDGRKPEDIRDIRMMIDYLPSAHGSALFTRGETQALATITLGGKLDEQLIDGATISGYNKTMLHYNFPGFSTGEVKPVRSPARREIGHAHLALNGIKPIFPENHPFTTRIVSEILESNGSSSMATVCAASLALSDAGIPIKKHVAGIAMGRISSQEKSIILSDISGEEDYFGEMDFKVTGTNQGLTACQLDIKIQGVSIEEVAQILAQAKGGLVHILEKMNTTIATPRSTRKPHAPSIYTVKIDASTIGALIGPSGKVIKDIQQSTGAALDILEKTNHAIVTVFSPNEKAGKAAVQRIESITASPTLDKIYTGKVKSIKPFGAFVEFMPGKDGLLHISEISEKRIESIEGIFKIGQQMEVKLINIHPQTGKFGLSCKGLKNS